MERIKFRISKTGDVSLEVSGAKGMDCEELTRVFEDAIGTKTDVKYKPAFWNQLDGIEQHVSEE